MSLWQNIGGTWRKGALWQNVAGTWRKGVLWQNIGGTWKSGGANSGSAGGTLAGSASPANVYGSVSRRQPTRVYTTAATASATGGSGAYTYAWAGDSDWLIESPSSATTRFSAIAPAGDSASATFTCVISDGIGGSVQVMVEAEVYNYYNGGFNADV